MKSKAHPTKDLIRELNSGDILLMFNFYKEII